MHYTVSYLIKNKIINKDGTIPKFNLSKEEYAKIIKELLDMLNNKLFQLNSQLFLIDLKNSINIKNDSKNNKILTSTKCAYFILKENLELFNS